MTGGSTVFWCSFSFGKSIDWICLHVIWQSEADHFRSSSGRSDIKNIDKWKNQTISSQKVFASGDRRLRKSLSHKDIAIIQDGYSVRFFLIFSLFLSFNVYFSYIQIYLLMKMDKIFLSYLFLWCVEDGWRLSLKAETIPFITYCFWTARVTRLL